MPTFTSNPWIASNLSAWRSGRASSWGDILKQDFSTADLLTVYLLPSSNDKIRPMLEKQLKKGARVVSHDFMFQDWKPVKEEHIEDDGEGRSHTLYLYIR